MTPEEKLKAVETALFPPAVKNKDGSKTILDVDDNLAAALYDLRRTGADKVCISTIENVAARLDTVRDILGSPAWHEK